MIGSISYTLFIFIISWFIARQFIERHNRLKIKVLNSTITQEEKIVDKLEVAYMETKHQLERLIDEGIVCRHQLLQKSNSLRKKSDELYRTQIKLKSMESKIKELKSLEESNRKLMDQISELEKFLNDDSSTGDGSLIDKVHRLEKSLKKRSKSEKSAVDHLSISKDQFEQIEKRLQEYKEKAEILEAENIQLISANKSKKESKLFKKMKFNLLSSKKFRYNSLLNFKI